MNAKKTFFLKSLSAIALLCLLASHSDLYPQPRGLNDTAISITVFNISERITYIDLAAADLNSELHKLNAGNCTESDLERVNKIQAYLNFRLQFMENLCNEFNYPGANNQLQSVKQSLIVTGANIETLTNNYYNKNATNQAAQYIINAAIEIIKNQFPYLSGFVDILVKYYGVIK